MRQTRDPEFLMSALRLKGLQGKSNEAERVYQRLAALGDRVTRVRDLRTKLALDPTDDATATEIRRLYEGLDAEMTSLETLSADFVVKDESVSPGSRLYVAHCSVCHGPEGDGNGLAARHLFPPPRDLRWEPSRLVGTMNGVPTLDDTVKMLRRGIPGTSMPSYANLDEDELRLLAEESHRIRREGLPERFMTMMEFQGEEVGEFDMEEIEEAVDLLTTPGDAIVIPPIGPALPASIACGKESYLQLGCASCHGEDGAGAADQFLYDERGFPARPRDLGREPFKGGHEAASIYQRILAGMPGSPHPSCSDVSQQSLIDVVQYCLALSREPKLSLTDDQRATLATSRDYLASLPRE
jgi:mono/diheme cytochrome c family protein